MSYTTDRLGQTVVVGDYVTYRLSDSGFDRTGLVTEVRDSGAMYVRNPGTGYADLMFPDHVTRVSQHTCIQEAWELP